MYTTSDVLASQGHSSSEKIKMNSSSTKTEMTKCVFESINQFRTKFIPDYYEDLKEDPEKDSIKYMNTAQSQLESYLASVDKFEEGSKPILRFLATSFAWLMYMEAVLEKRAALEIQEGKEVSTNLLEKITMNVGNTATKLLTDCIHKDLGLDWKIGRKILSIQRRLKNFIKIEIDPYNLLDSFQLEINRALDFLIWKKKEQQNHQYTYWTLKYLLDLIKDDQNYFKNNKIKFEDLLKEKKPLIQTRFLEAIITGRFDKNVFGIENTLIIGDDGGLYMLLNNKKFINNTMLTFNDFVPKSFLDSKIVKKTKDSKNRHQLAIGEGGFGKLRFGMSLFTTDKARPGDIICLKKSKSYSKMSEKTLEKNNRKLSEGEALFEFADSVMKDYFASDVAEIIKAPKVLDVALISDYSLDDNHKKGYLMMEVVPHNNGKATFEIGKYQKWEYQKPFLLDIFEGTQKLLNMNIVQTDLKLENTLFDTITRKATIIDLGGILKLKNAKEVQEFTPSDGGFDATKEYCPPELNNENNDKIDLNLSLVYICGRILMETMSKTDLPEESIEKINAIVTRTLSIDQSDRGTLENLIDDIKKIGDEKYKESILAMGYIDGIKDKITKDLPCLSLNEDILIIQKVFTSIDVTKQNPILLENQETKNLFAVIDDYFENAQEQVLLIMGSAGSGKSIALQLKFIKAVNEWVIGKPLPVYFNLANETCLENNFEILNKQIRSNIVPKDLNLHLYLDSFDEGFEMEAKRHSLVKNYLSVLGNKSKVLITCRTEYLNSEDDLVWFHTKEKNLLYYYITPFNYGHTKDFKSLAKRWLDKKGKMQLKRLNTSQNEKILNSIQLKGINNIIDTGFIFELVMTTLPVLLSSKEQSANTNNFSKFLLYNTFLEIYVEEKVSQLYTYQQKKLKGLLEDGLGSLKSTFDSKELFATLIKEKTFKLDKEGRNKTDNEKNAIDLSVLVEILGMYIAIEIYKTRKFRIDCASSPIFKALGFRVYMPFKDQAVYYALSLLPMKIEMRKLEIEGEAVYEVQTGFTHNIIQNLFLFKGIEYELKKKGTSKILSFNNIRRNAEFVRFLTESLEDSYKPILKEFIIKSKTDKSKEAATLAANSMTLLVAMGEKFLNENFENINIPRANLRNGIFENTNFRFSNLRGAVLRNANLDKCNFKGANLEKIDLGVYPNLKIGIYPNQISFSLDNNTLTVFERGNEGYNFQLIDVNKDCEINRVECKEKNEIFISYMFNADQTLFATGNKKHVEVWDLQNLNKIKCIELEEKGTYDLFFNIKNEILLMKFLESKNQLILEGLEDKSYNKIITVPMFSDIYRKDYYGSSLCGRKYLLALKKEIQEEGVKGEENNLFIIIDLDSSDYFSIKSNQWLKCYDFSKDLKTVVLGCYDNDEPGLFLYDIQHSTTKENVSFKKLKGHSKLITQVYFSPDGKRIIGGSFDNCVRVWDALSAQLLLTLVGLKKKVISLTFSYDGNKIAAGSKNEIRIWNAIGNESYSKLESHKAKITSVAFSPDGNTFASASLDETVRLWETNSGKQILTITGHKDSVYCLAFSIDGEVLATACGDKNVYIWDTKNGLLIKNFQAHLSEVRTLAFSKDKTKLATGGKDCLVKVWDAKSYNIIQEMIGITEGGLCVEFVNELLASGSKDGWVQLWNKDGTLAADINLNDEVVCLKFDEFKGILYCAAGSAVHILCQDEFRFKQKGHIEFELTKLSSITSINKKTIKCLAICKVNNYLAIGSSKIASLYDLETNKFIQLMKGHSFDVSALAFSKNEAFLLTGSIDSTIGLWASEKEQALKGAVNFFKEIASFFDADEESEETEESEEESGCYDKEEDEEGFSENGDEDSSEECDEQEEEQSNNEQEGDKENDENDDECEGNEQKGNGAEEPDVETQEEEDEGNSEKEEHEEAEIKSQDEVQEEDISQDEEEEDSQIELQKDIYKFKFFTSKLENDLSAENMVLEEVKISKVNELVFKQRGAKTEKNHLEAEKTEKTKNKPRHSPFILIDNSKNSKKGMNFIPCKISSETK